MRLAVIDTIYPDYPANDVGFEKGDKIISVNGKPIQFFEESTPLIAANGKNENLIVVSRNNQIDSIKVTANDEGKIGINAFGKELKLGKTEIKYSLTESIVGGFGYGYNTLKDYVSQFKYVFTKKGATQVGGFGAIGNLFPDAWDWQSFWATTALISIILAFMNILPIPALDGGHVMFLLYEIVTGRKPNDKFMEYAQMVGFFILIALVLFANGNDIYRWLFE
jgi:regulator of sigma E protease